MQFSSRNLITGAAADNSSIKDLREAVLGSGSAGLVVQTYANTILQQPDITLPADLLAKIPVDVFLKTARTHADNYLNNIQPGIINTIQDVNGYSTQFSSFNKVISQSINTWKMGNNLTAKQEALDLLKQLQIGLTSKQNKVILVSKDLGKLLLDLNGDVANFTTAVSTADIEIGADSKVIGDLENTISSFDSKIAGAASGVALSGLVAIGGGLLIVVGAGLTPFTFGASTGLIVAGAAVVVVGAGGLTASSVVLSSLISGKSDAIRQKAILTDDLNALHLLKPAFVNLQSSASNAIAQVNNMANAWNILGGNLGNVIGSISDAQTFSDLPVVVQAYLDTANDQWADVKTAVQTINQQMTGVQTKILKDGNGKLIQLNNESILTAAEAA
ncbi:HBL/NHE enterotoxin family protein [Haliscomenobacter hydrossis]|uniref:Hemolytic enterotoxin n=1 Tax=Haliscomenobacter hydrossis (strain ATCC 27775 / DSM 1100 / LMG 10767 / O) TaxID=760192 RepID=F4KUV6_HALH1|nr:HBL/NHE enterotoxin family protein [Haliscomenobacter hydrossis]AEE48132.1 hemolytic enterotoxin [Haliscomenobacter hydrossis DSM 1100]